MFVSIHSSCWRVALQHQQHHHHHQQQQQQQEQHQTTSLQLAGDTRKLKPHYKSSPSSSKQTLPESTANGLYCYFIFIFVNSSSWSLFARYTVLDSLTETAGACTHDKSILLSWQQVAQLSQRDCAAGWSQFWPKEEDDILQTIQGRIQEVCLGGEWRLLGPRRRGAEVNRRRREDRGAEGAEGWSVIFRFLSSKRRVLVHSGCYILQLNWMENG